MKKILSQEEKEKRERKNRTIIGTILVFILLISTAGYSFNSMNKTEKTDSLEYKNIDFVLQGDGYWHFVLNGKEFATSFNPLETANITVDSKYNIDYYKNKVLYFDSNNDMQVVSEIARNIGNNVLRMQEACFGDCDKNLPIKDCSSLIVITKQGENSVKQNENCTFIYFEKDEGIRTADSWIFSLLNLK